MNAETENVKTPAGAEDVIIRVEGLKRYYARGKIKALDGIDLSVRRGEVVVIIGPSGSGKSTLLRSLNLLEIPTAGSVFMEGMDITDRHADINLHRQKMGMVFQHFNLFPHMTVLRNMTLAPIKLKGKTREQAEEQAMELLGKVGLADRANAYPDQLSGGQKQRVAIVRALCMHPEILLFDEVTAALDPEMVREVLDVMLDLARDGKTMVIVTHEMQFARAVANRVLFLDGGRIVEEAPPAQFFDHPQTERAKKFLNTFTFEAVK